jgi:hypothetical protein
MNQIVTSTADKDGEGTRHHLQHKGKHEILEVETELRHGLERAVVVVLFAVVVMVAVVWCWY